MQNKTFYYFNYKAYLYYVLTKSSNAPEQDCLFFTDSCTLVSITCSASYFDHCVAVIHLPCLTLLSK